MGRGDGDWATEADVAAYDREAARTFGRALTESEPLPWRTGPVGELTIEELDQASGLTFGRFHGARESDLRRQVEETQRQIAVERAVLEKVKLHGWPKVIAAATGEERKVAESASHRTGGKSAAEILESGRRSRWGS